MAFDIVSGQPAIFEHGIQRLSVHGYQGQIQMNDQEHADDHKTGGVYETAEFLYSLMWDVHKYIINLKV